MLIWALVLGVLAAAAVYAVVSARAGRDGREVLERARGEAAARVARARLEAAAIRTAHDTEAREASLVVREQALAEIEQTAERLGDREAAVVAGQAEVAARADEVAQRQRDLEADERERRARGDRLTGLDQDVERRRREASALLEARAQVTGDQLVGELTRRWIETAHAEAAAAIRAVEQGTTDPATDREARRVLEIAGGRYRNHFLTERNLSTIRVDPAVLEVLTRDGGAVHAALEQVCGIHLLVGEIEGAVRLEGLDGLGREVARRALTRLGKRADAAAEASAAPEAWATKLREHLDTEVRTLGKKAFQTLGVPRAHPEIVELVGALNWRTSYTQNQWLHAVEASFLAGMMAAELGLDQKLARRATLMHDIGKALTHKIEGSHAVIGADIARRLGESEVVANAIGAHHADEPPGSVYAYLVAAADAMSGARPGARREMAEGFSARVEDLERIGASYKGVDRAHAVHGGRELRVYVREREVDDLAVVELSSEIAARISEEMTFPGQIKVTIIRSFEAVTTAS